MVRLQHRTLSNAARAFIDILQKDSPVIDAEQAGLQT
jgi:hypothetical protein